MDLTRYDRRVLERRPQILVPTSSLGADPKSFRLLSAADDELLKVGKTFNWKFRRNNNFIPLRQEMREVGFTPSEGCEIVAFKSFNVMLDAPPSNLYRKNGGERIEGTLLFEVAFINEDMSSFSLNPVFHNPSYPIPFYPGLLAYNSSVYGEHCVELVDLVKAVPTPTLQIAWRNFLFSPFLRVGE